LLLRAAFATLLLNVSLVLYALLSESYLFLGYVSSLHVAFSLPAVSLALLIWHARRKSVPFNGNFYWQCALFLPALVVPAAAWLPFLSFIPFFEHRRGPTPSWP